MCEVRENEMAGLSMSLMASHGRFVAFSMSMRRILSSNGDRGCDSRVGFPSMYKIGGYFRVGRTPPPLISSSSSWIFDEPQARTSQGVSS
jgi:hypothetical protein